MTRHILVPPLSYDKVIASADITFDIENMTDYSTPDLITIMQAACAAAMKGSTADSPNATTATLAARARVRFVLPRGALILVDYWRGSPKNTVRVTRDAVGLIHVEIVRPEKIKQDIIERVGAVENPRAARNIVDALARRFQAVVSNRYVAGTPSWALEHFLRITRNPNGAAGKPSRYYKRRIDIESLKLSRSEARLLRLQERVEAQKNVIKTLAEKGGITL